MNLDDIRKILDLVREHDLVEFELERDGLKVRVRKAGHDVSVMPSVLPLPVVAAPAAVPGVVGHPVATPAPAVAPVPAEPEPQEVDLAVIKAPMVGTFYRSPEPGAKNFVEIGDTVKKGQVLCIIEAMKLMNEIESEADGEITAAYVDNGRPVQFGDRLFALRVSPAS
jgi:acetyl-CoA carboxylase biotin carboxyl carrier protein